MFKCRVFFALGIGLLCGIAPQIAAGQESSSVIAQVGDRKITFGELQEKEAGMLLQAQYKYFLAEREALNHLVDEQLLELAAAKEKVSMDELLKKHVDVNVIPPTEDQLKFYYEGLDTDEPYEAVKDKILDTVRTLRTNKAREVYVSTLRNDFNVSIDLVQPAAHVDVADAPRLGPKDAPVQLVEFADYECPYCQKVHLELKKLREQYGDKVAVVYKDFPLPMHPLAKKAAEAASCAKVQGKFWEYHDALFETKKFQVPDLKAQAVKLNLNMDRFNQCLDKGEQSAAVRKDATEALHLGLTGTPSFFANGHFLSGAVSFMQLTQTVQDELNTLPNAKPAGTPAPTSNGGGN
jgi:predicted DsbA family dithiol-disulfide isomerase